MANNKNQMSWAPAVIKLLQDAMYSDDKYWNELMNNQLSVIEYFETIGVKLIIDENEGFAYIFQPEEDEDNSTPSTVRLPRLVRKTPLSYEVTLLSVLLREILEDHDLRGTDSVKLFLTNRDIKDKIELFFKEQSNKVKLLKNFDAYINTVVNLGFLKMTHEDTSNKDNNQYEVKRILKAKISNEKLEEIKQKLNEYIASV